MNLLFLEERPRFSGGSERMSLALCRHAIRRGHAAFLAYSELGDMVAAYTAAGASCERIPATPIAVRHPVTAYKSFASLTSLVRRHRIDCLFTSQVNYVSLLALAGRTTGACTAVHLGVAYDYPSPVFRTGTKMIGLGVTPSEHTAEEWRRRQWPLKSLRVIPNGIDTEVFMPAGDRAEARLRTGLADIRGPLVAYVGRLVEEKGIFTLLRAFAAHRRNTGRGVLLFVGTPQSTEVQQLERLARKEGLSEDAIQIRASTPKPEDIYVSADLVVVPSEWEEPFGLVPLEAMACGTLAVVSDAGILPQFVAPLNGRAVFKAGDVNSLKSRLDDWLSDPEGRASAAHTLAAVTRERFSFDRCGDAYLHEIRTMVDGRS